MMSKAQDFNKRIRIRLRRNPVITVLFIPIIPLIWKLGGYSSLTSLQANDVNVNEPFSTLPSIRVTLTPVFNQTNPPDILLNEIPPPTTILQILDVLKQPRAVLGMTVGLLVSVLGGIYFFRHWHFQNFEKLRFCNIPKLIDGVVIAAFGALIGTLGLALVAAGTAEGIIGLHSLAVGGLMLIVGGVFVYLGTMIVVDSGCISKKGG